jgi:hypothetical protein
MFESLAQFADVFFKGRPYHPVTVTPRSVAPKEKP